MVVTVSLQRLSKNGYFNNIFFAVICSIKFCNPLWGKNRIFCIFQIHGCVPTSSSYSPLVSTIKTDWSRTSQTKLALLKVGSNRNQAKITSIFDRIMNLMTINPNVFQNSSIQAISSTQDTTERC